MDAIFALFVVIVSLLGLGIAALGWGADSRPDIADDHLR
jgi:hypothetical protein